jgi:methylmalonyl-CoA carboxyltransferase large subunit
MPPESIELARLIEAVEALRGEVARLSERVSAIESAAPATARAAAATPTDTHSQVINPELLFTISAAVAAYLGKRAHVRQIRLLGSAAWAQQGRVTVQASHRLEVQHGS